MANVNHASIRTTHVASGVLIALAAALLVGGLFLDQHNIFNSPMKLFGYNFLWLAAFVREAQKATARNNQIAFAVSFFLAAVLCYVLWNRIGYRVLLPGLGLLLLNGCTLLWLKRQGEPREAQ